MADLNRKLSNGVQILKNFSRVSSLFPSVSNNACFSVQAARKKGDLPPPSGLVIGSPLDNEKVHTLSADVYAFIATKTERVLIPVERD